jgi:hypothetical protein
MKSGQKIALLYSIRGLFGSSSIFSTIASSELSVSQYKTMSFLSNIIDTSNPIWLELCAAVNDSRLYFMDENNCDKFFRLFTKDQLIMFTTAFPKILDVKEQVVCSVLRSARANSAIRVLDILEELWGCEYDGSTYDYVKVCLEDHNNTSSEVILFLKYFIDHGATLQKHHAAHITDYGNTVMKFMVQHGLDPNDVALAYCEYVKRRSPEIMEGLHFLSDTGVDLVGYIYATKHIKNCTK